MVTGLVNSKVLESSYVDKIQLIAVQLNNINVLNYAIDCIINGLGWTNFYKLT